MQYDFELALSAARPPSFFLANVRKQTLPTSVKTEKYRWRRYIISLYGYRNDTEGKNTVLCRPCVNVSANFKVTIFFFTDTDELIELGTDTSLLCVNRPL